MPPREELDGQLEVLAERGWANGATVEFWDEQQLHELIPEARSASGRALWSPNTAVVKPLKVVQWLQQELQQQGVQLITASPGWRVQAEECSITLSDGSKLSYGHLYIRCRACFVGWKKDC